MTDIFTIEVVKKLLALEEKYALKKFDITFHHGEGVVTIKGEAILK